MRGRLAVAAKRHALPMALFALLMVYYLFTSDYFPFTIRHLGFDQGVYSYMGLAAREGLTLYVDAWDNKGPLLYLLNVLGLAIHYQYGMLVVEAAAQLTAMALLYQTALRYTGRALATLATLLCWTLMSICLQGGNLTEEYSLPFLAYILYQTVCFFGDGYALPRRRIFWVGCAIGAVFLLRANNLALALTLALVLVLWLLTHRQWAMLGRVALFVALGFCCFLAPFALYLWRVGALEACIQACYGTLGLFTTPTKLETLQNLHDMLVGANITGLLYLALVWMGLWLLSRLHREPQPPQWLYPLWACFLALPLNLLLNSLSGQGYYHYCQTFISILVLPAAWLLQRLYSHLGPALGSPWRAHFALGAAALLLCFPSFTFATNESLHNLRGGSDPFHPMEGLTDMIQEKTTSQGRIQVIGEDSAPSLYYHANRLAASKYFYTSVPSFTQAFRQEIAQEVEQAIYQHQPELILFVKQAEADRYFALLPDPQPLQRYLASHYQEPFVAPNYYIAYLRRDTP